MDEKNSTAHLIIFVHGTICSELCLFNLRKTYQGTLDDATLTLRLLKLVRKNSRMFADQAMLDEGMHQLDATILSAIQTGVEIPDYAHQAAYFIAAAYDAITKEVDTDAQRFYYTFGHAGILSGSHRMQAAGLFYHDVCQLQAQFKEKYDTVRITIQAHSHGGNVSLLLHAQEEIYRRGLRIDTLALWGTPIQQETALYAHSHVFRKIFNFYALGDRVQIVDSVSTQARRSYRTFSELNRMHAGTGTVYDIRISINKNPKIIGHLNMWFLTYANPLFSIFDPLPFMVLSAQVLDRIKDLQTLSNLTLDVFFDEPNKICQLRLHNEVSCFLETSCLYQTLTPIQQHIKTLWRPEKGLEFSSWVKKEGRAIWQAIKMLWDDAKARRKL